VVSVTIRFLVSNLFMQSLLFLTTFLYTDVVDLLSIEVVEYVSQGIPLRVLTSLCNTLTVVVACGYKTISLQRGSSGPIAKFNGSAWANLLLASFMLGENANSAASLLSIGLNLWYVNL
jgi:hypothetical protein